MNTRTWPVYTDPIPNGQLRSAGDVEAPTLADALRNARNKYPHAAIVKVLDLDSARRVLA